MTGLAAQPLQLSCAPETYTKTPLRPSLRRLCTRGSKACQMSGWQSRRGFWSLHSSLAHHWSCCRPAVWAYITGSHGSLGPCNVVCLHASTSLQACSLASMALHPSTVFMPPAWPPEPTILHACRQDVSLRDPGTAGFALDGILAHVLRQARLGTDLRVPLHLVH